MRSVFIRGAASHDTQDEIYKLLGLIWAGAPAAEAAAQARRLLALQRAEGGWGQVPTMTPDAYATGQALYALHASGRTAHDCRVRERRAVPPSYSARRWDVVCPLESFRLSAVFRIGLPAWKRSVHLGGRNILGGDGTGVRPTNRK